jgi:hypothetical protein
MTNSEWITPSTQNGHGPGFEIQQPPVEDDKKNQRLPKIHVAQRVIQKMCVGALTYQDEETGESLVGISPKNGNDQKLPQLYILDTISPIEEAIREWAMFEQGDEWQGAIFNWWHDNWELYRNLRRSSYGNAVAAKWDVPLLHLGDWHKQPGMIRPSRGDFRTARRFMRDIEVDFLITPIVTLAHEVFDPVQKNTILVNSETPDEDIRIDFWWIAKRGNDFEPIEPIVEPNESLPRLPPIIWRLGHRERFDQELDALEADGLQIMDVVEWDTRGHPPLYTCITIYRPGSRYVFIAITPVNYPLRPPMWRVAPIMRPKEDEDFFEMLYKASSEIPINTLPKWSVHSLLLDGLKTIEQQEHKLS